MSRLITTFEAAPPRRRAMRRRTDSIHWVWVIRPVWVHRPRGASTGCAARRLAARSSASRGASGLAPDAAVTTLRPESSSTTRTEGTTSMPGVASAKPKEPRAIGAAGPGAGSPAASSTSTRARRRACPQARAADRIAWRPWTSRRRASPQPTIRTRAPSQAAVPDGSGSRSVRGAPAAG
jgi:hypothetical protein